MITTIFMSQAHARLFLKIAFVHIQLPCCGALQCMHSHEVYMAAGLYNSKTLSV